MTWLVVEPGVRAKQAGRESRMVTANMNREGSRQDFSECRIRPLPEHERSGLGIFSSGVPFLTDIGH